ncbi:hypothetical protein [Halodurantibacterium flavum]|uniref:Uncharacterized protein n=1 Tax=Halodurantibacterium flavum TaxID=1382802 RepID=A0ABW4S9M1_9RHOB
MTARKAGRRPASTPSVGRQEIWEAIRLQAGGFTAASLSTASGANRKTIEDYLRCLHPAGVIERAGEDGWRLADDRGHHAPRLNRAGKPVVQGAGTENMWRSMRMLATFSPRDISAHSSTPEVQVTEPTAKSYCGMLLRCGYLRVIRKASPGVRQATYRLIRNSGPKPPQVQRVKRIYDPNTGEVHMPGER